ncbi:uncharacterized protein LOC112576009 [Pomacea canaliculata]|uniref:uncharacterized protein LOC112576009 n=1 Tax=Pomacea canaliculata TaxID=400727 RepID=UPI000D72F481|nr:uncharacterized protein LOC112576009 [Pomacea canaliculata]
MCRLHLGVAIVVTWAALTMAQVEDLTKQEGGKGPAVVEAVVRLIRQSCVFPNDHLLLRRFAFVETDDGLDPNTYRAGFNGGIWAVSETDFRNTQNDPRLSRFYEDITQRFGIDWNRLTWDQLRKPIYSGLATALYIAQKFNGQAIPVSKEEQAAWYQSNIHPQNLIAAYNYTKQSDRLESGTICGSSNIDLAFVVDTSSSLSPENFESAKTFASNVVDTFNIAPDSVQIAFMTFSSDVQLQFDFNDFSSKEAVKNAISRVQMKLGNTATDKALDFAASQLFTAADGVRPNSAKVAVLLTDGKADRHSSAVASAQRLKDLGVTIFVIGVGDVDRNELESLASNPVCTHVQQLTDYQDLDLILSDIRQMSCEAPVVVQEGHPQQFPCGTSSNFMISFSGPATVTVQPTQGFVNIYGSFFNPHPSPVSKQFATIANASQAAIIYVNQMSTLQPLYINVDTTGNDPAICHRGSSFTLTIQRGSKLQFGSVLTCVKNGMIGECSVLDILTSQYNVSQPSNLGIPNPCTPGHPGYFAYADSTSRVVSYNYFIYCSAEGILYLVECPYNSWYNNAFRQCVPGIPPTVTTISPIISHVTPPAFTLPPVTPGTYYNPCTAEQISRGNFFFPYPGDDSKYIQCTEWPNFAVVKDCAPYHKWEQRVLNCIYNMTVVDPTHDQYLTSPSPLDFNCTYGLQTGDLFYHPYPNDHTKYIQCDQFGNAFVKSCQSGRIWNQYLLTCIPSGVFSGSGVPVGK